MKSLTCKITPPTVCITVCPSSRSSNFKFIFDFEDEHRLKRSFHIHPHNRYRSDDNWCFFGRAEGRAQSETAQRREAGKWLWLLCVLLEPREQASTLGWYRSHEDRYSVNIVPISFRDTDVTLAVHPRCSSPYIDFLLIWVHSPVFGIESHFNQTPPYLSFLWRSY